MNPKIIVKRHRPWFRPVLIVLITAAVAIAAWALYSYTRATTVSDFEETRVESQKLSLERRELMRELRDARTQAQELREQVVFLERSQEIDRQACQNVRGSLVKLQSEVSDLQEQVAFYRGIVSPGEARTGVRVYDFKVHTTETKGRLRYELVLIQSVRHDRRITGRVEIAIQGARDSRTQTVSFGDLTAGSERNLLFSFKYFQEFSGEFELPEGFNPLRVTIAVVPEGSGQTRVEDVYDWSKIQGV